MTLGQRIQELRRKHNLSQEALGEAMGVSRQAISKWESDSAIPEVDKLIAMSKLFSVRVGFLLGVEEAACDRADEELTDRELERVEAVTLACLEQDRAARRARQSWVRPVAILGTIFLLALVTATVSWWNTYIAAQTLEINGLKDQLTHLQEQQEDQRQNLTDQIGQMGGQLEDKLEQMLEQQAKLLLDWSCQWTGFAEGGAAFDLSVTPKEYAPGMTATFTAQNSRGESVSAQGEWNGTAFVASLSVPLWETAEFSASLDDGTIQKQQILTVEYDLASKFGLAAGTCVTTGQWTLLWENRLKVELDTAVQLKAVSRWDLDWENLWPEQVWLSLRYEDTELERIDLDVSRWPGQVALAQWNAAIEGEYTVEGAGGDLKLYLCSVTNVGTRSEDLIFRRMNLAYGSGNTND